MRCAIISVSRESVKLANRLSNFYNSTDIYVNKKYNDFAPINAIFYNKVFELVSKIFYLYDAIIFICAAGIAVRSIAPYIKSKISDPAILVVDEKGKFVISLLSGHIGGANLLSKKIANIIGGISVVTTATDANEIIAPDFIASILNLTPYPKDQIVNINNALLNNEKIYYFLDKNLIHSDFYKSELKKFNIDVTITDRLNFEKNKYYVFITNTYMNFKNTLCLIPRKLIAGIGCRRRTEKEKILFAIEDACHKIGLDSSFINLIATSILKANERGILEIANELKTEIKFFSNDKLQEKIDEYKLKESDFVKKILGAGNVSEAAALAAAKCPKFALGKTKYEKVTVALVWEKSL